MIFVVLGMHKSGTTLISEILHHSGINMVDHADSSLSYDRGNKWERESAKQINQELLGTEGAFSLEKDHRPAILASEQQARMRELIDRSTRHYGDWGFKDPRTCRVYDLWASVLPEHKIIAVYRSPEEAWEHYRRISGRQLLKAMLQFLPTWCEYNRAILEYLLRTRMPFLVIQYERFMKDPAEFERLERFVGCKLNDRRDPKLHRSRVRKFGFYPLLRAVHALRGKEPPGRIVREMEAHRA